MTAPAPQGRSVTLPGTARRGRGNVRGRLLVLGVILTVGSAAGFWYVLDTLDERQEVLVAARDIDRFDVVGAQDFMVIEANVGAASVLAPDDLNSQTGRWASGDIPAGAIVARGMFLTPPLSRGDETSLVLTEVSLPQSEAPFGGLRTGDRVALIGIDIETAAVGESSLSLIGVLDLDFVSGDKITYIATPERAREINDIVDRFRQAGNRKIWKIGTDVTEEQLKILYPEAVTVPLAVDELLAEAGSGAEPVPAP